jgi:uncharacterized protein (TIGR03437 family)
MFTRKKFIVNSALVTMAIAPIVLYAYEYGPDPGYTGAPGDNATACIASGCHTGTLNSQAGGSIKIVASGGTTYVPGQTQKISVTITDPTERRFGFQLAARVDSNPSKTQAGSFTPTDGLTQVLCPNGDNAPATGCTDARNGGTLQWAEHTLDGYKASGAPSYTYTFNWTPPSTNVGNITLYGAGNAVSGALVVTGTHTFTSTLRLTPSTGGGGPTPNVTAVVNDASFAAPIASGSWVAVFGTNLAPESSNRKWNESTEIVNGKLPISLDGTSVKVNNKDAVVEFVSPGQINIQPPDDTATGPVPVVVTTASGASNTFMVNLAAFAPGLFPATAPYIVAQHADNSYVTSASPAKPNETIILWGTGFGAASPAVPAGQVFSGANKLVGTVTATVGGVSVTPDFAGVVGAGLVQINLKVPGSAATGNVPVVLTVGGASTFAVWPSCVGRLGKPRSDGIRPCSRSARAVPHFREKPLGFCPALLTSFRLLNRSPAKDRLEDGAPVLKRMRSRSVRAYALQQFFERLERRRVSRPSYRGKPGPVLR